MHETTTSGPHASPPCAPPHLARPARAGTLGRIMLVLPAAALLLTPFVLLATAAIEEPSLLAILAEKPRISPQLALGLLVSILFCTLPFSRLVDGAPARDPAHASSGALGR